MSQECPYCDSTSPVLDEGEGIRRCRDCGRSSLTEELGKNQTKPSSRTEDSGVSLIPSQSDPSSRRFRDQRGAPGEVPSLPSALVAFVVALLFYGLLAVLPESGFSELFLRRGWVPYAITLISLWALSLLGARLLRLRRERLALDQDLVAANSDGHLFADDAAAALDKLNELPPGISESFLARRIERALRHFQSRRHPVEVVEFLAMESRADEGRIDASYGLVRVFVWAVPTLGFIGTVIGIGGAVAGFSETLEAASSLEGMKASIGSVTGGLGVAFDTTLLALVMSILIMFPASAIQRIEENFLSDVDDYCAQHLVPRLMDDPIGQEDDAMIVALAKRLVLAMRNVEGQAG